MCIPISKCVITIDYAYAIKGGLEVKLPSYEKLLVVVFQRRAVKTAVIWAVRLSAQDE